VLLGGRTELLASIPAIYDSPILGHGSWARDPLYLIGMARALALMGYEGDVHIDRSQFIEGQIPAHSYIFQAWVDGGVLGAVFWGWILVLTAKGLMRVYPGIAVLLPAVSFLAFLLLWNIPFSPYGTQERITFPYTIVMLMTCADMTFRGARPAVAKPARQIPRSKPKRIA
jgi:O-antigen ligase